jgi:outer membrane immunogenic protein
MKIVTLTAAAALLASSGFVNAADVYNAGASAKDAPVASVPKSWTGVYVSGGIGGHFVNHELSVANFASLDGISAQGVFGTVGGGADLQAGRLVFGVFGDFDFSDASTELKFPALASTASVDLNHVWTVGARAGLLVTPATLAYVLAGYSEAEFEASGTGLASGFKGSETLTGYTLGAGLETQIGGGFSLKGEYRWTNLDDIKIGGVNVDTDVQSVRAVVSYKLPVGALPLN